MHEGPRINSYPEPKHLRVAAQARAHLIQLHMRDIQMAEGALVEGLRMGSSTQEPPGDGRMPKSKDSFSRRHIQSFCQHAQHERHLV
jgi:hypothetical protein